MGISLKSSFNADKKSKELTKKFDQRLGTAMEYQVGKIVARTNKGQGADGELKEYSKGKIYRDKKGKEMNFFTKGGKVRPLESYFDYKLRTKGKTTVNLTESGNMLQGMQSDVQENAQGLLGRIFFLPSEQQKARWNIALRPNFFKLTKEQLANIVKTLRGK